MGVRPSDKGNGGEQLASEIRDKRDTVSEHIQCTLHVHAETGRSYTQPVGETLKTENIFKLRKAARWEHMLQKNAGTPHDCVYKKK